ncbi:MAG: glycosyltransferase [Candidatus Nanopelagicales bacterium]
MSGARKALVYGDVNLNILDGSAIWVQSITEALSRCGVQVRVLLKAPVETARLVDPLRALPGVTVVDPFTESRAPARSPLMPVDAVRILGQLDAEDRADLVVVRGLKLVSEAAASRLAGRLWTYLTDIPQSPVDITSEVVEQLSAVAEASRFMLCQTEELRDLLESTIPAACGRSVLWSPVVPEPDFPLPAREPLMRDGRQARPVRLVYTGKFAPLWNTLQMTALPGRLAALGIDAQLHVVGDKIHDVPGDPEWSTRMREALETSPGVIWHGGVPRQEAMRLTAEADLGMSWRAPEMDASLELSTKVLEFGSLGVPALLNRTPMHESLLGESYPLFVGDETDIVNAITSVLADDGLLEDAQDAMARAAAPFGMAPSSERLSLLLERAFPAAPSSIAAATTPRPLRVGVVSHDLKFFTRILDYLAALPGVDVRLDAWSSLSTHDTKASEEMVAWADVIVCEWAGPNLVWYSRHKRDGQRLIVRLHRFELEAGWLKDVRIEAVDQVVCVSPFYAALTAERTGWPAERIVVIPNWVDVEQFARPKLEGVEFVLGMIGISPMRKRPDLGLEVLSHLRRRDGRYRLAVKSKLPWDYWWIWRKPEERADTEAVFARLHADPTLRGAVTFDGFGGDVPAWLRRVGWVLSTSDDESFHLAPAEGMASGAVPALLPWPGADTIYDTRWIHADPVAMAAAIHETVASGTWAETAAAAQRQVTASFPLETVCESWADILVQDASPDTAQGTLAKDA